MDPGVRMVMSNPKQLRWRQLSIKTFHALLANKMLIEGEYRQPSTLEARASMS